MESIVAIILFLVSAVEGVFECDNIKSVMVRMESLNQQLENATKLNAQCQTKLTQATQQNMDVSQVGI